MTNSSGSNPSAAGPGTSAPGQPRWAWWVVGIVVPVVGIATTVFVNNRHSSADDSKPPAVAGAPSATPDQAKPAASADPASPENTASRAMFGPHDIQFRTSAYGVDIDFDTRKPLVADGLKGADLSAVTDGSGTAGSTNFHGGPRLAAIIAPISGSDADPTEAQCAKALRSNGDPMLQDPPQNAQFCVQTTEGRIAFVRVVSAAPGGHTMRLRATVWDLAT
ncbi:hypothetical protein [Streptomyces nigra]|uniref:hypothetical protein n=1 Tax=Streptomyces nigra TaxID=1827580 RepID=UPI003434496C